MILRPTTLCTACKAPILVGHYVHEVWLVERVTHGGPLTAGPPEAAHAVCEDPTKGWRADKSIRQQTLKTTDMSDKPTLAPSHQCKNCFEVFRKGDRIVQIVCVEGIAFDTQMGAPGIKCSGDEEYAHKDCSDRGLDKGRSVILLSS